MREHMIFDLERGEGVGVYLRPSVAAARHGHDEAFRQRILAALRQRTDLPALRDTRHGRHRTP